MLENGAINTARVVFKLSGRPVALSTALACRFSLSVFRALALTIALIALSQTTGTTLGKSAADEIFSTRTDYHTSYQNLRPSERLGHSHIKDVLNFVEQDINPETSSDTLQDIYNDLLTVLPEGSDLTSLVREGHNLGDYAQYLHALTTVSYLLEGPKREILVADPRKPFQPRRTYHSLTESLEDISFNFDGYSARDWSRRIHEAFLMMQEKAVKTELSILAEFEKKLDPTGSRAPEILAQAVEATDRELMRRIRDEEESIQTKINGWGRAELTVNEDSGGRVKVVKIVHFKSERAFYFVCVDTLPADSRHYHVMLARGLVHGGTHRIDGKRGRDSIAIIYRNNGQALGMQQILEVRDYRKPESKLSREFLTLWRWATVHPVNGATAIEQVFCSLFQFGLILGLGYLEIELLNQNHRSWDDVLKGATYTFFFGSVIIGLLIDTWIYWEGLPKDKKTRTQRKLVKSLLYAIPFTFLITGKAISDLGSWFRIITNSFVNGYVKANTFVLVDLAEEAGLARRQFPVPLLGRIYKKDGGWRETVGTWFQWKWRRMIYNLTEVYLNLPVKVLALMNFSILVPLGSAGVNLPVGLMAFLLYVPVSAFEAAQIAEHYNLRSKNLRHANWNKTKQDFRRIIDHSVSLIEDLAIVMASRGRQTLEMEFAKILGTWDDLNASISEHDAVGDTASRRLQARYHRIQQWMQNLRHKLAKRYLPIKEISNSEWADVDLSPHFNVSGAAASVVGVSYLLPRNAAVHLGSTSWHLTESLRASAQSLQSDFGIWFGSEESAKAYRNKRDASVEKAKTNLCKAGLAALGWAKSFKHSFGPF